MADDFARLARCLARSFETDPVLQWLLPDPASRLERASAFYEIVLQHFAGAGQISTDGTLRGCAIWQPPTPPSIGIVAQLSYSLRMIGILRGTSLKGFRMLGEMERIHYRPPHWYLALLGTDPDHWGQGVASSLLTPVLDRCDRDAVPAYLESSKESNLSFYRRHGFEVVKKIKVDDGPTLWPMLRLPA